jgi:hypothetical protein
VTTWSKVRVRAEKAGRCHAAPGRAFPLGGARYDRDTPGTFVGVLPFTTGASRAYDPDGSVRDDRLFKWASRRDDDAVLRRQGWTGRDLDRLALLSCVLLGLIFGVGQATGLVSTPIDAAIYWATDPAHPYPLAWGSGGTTSAYIYPPPFALLIGLLHPVGWQVFIVVFTTSTWWAFWYCTRAWAPVVLVVSLLAIPWTGGGVLGYLFLGNVQILMAAAVVASIRASPAWAAVPLLTKLTGIPLVWYAARREWRQLGIAVTATGAVVLGTMLVAPGIWGDFVSFVATNRIEQSAVPLVPVAFPVRLALAVTLVAWGGMTDRRWTVPIGVGLAIPALYWWSFLAIWIGAIGVTWSAEPNQRLLAARLLRLATSWTYPKVLVPVEESTSVARSAAPLHMDRR